MGNSIKIAKQPSEDIYCGKCKGHCFNKSNSAATQENAKKLFGIIPNKCVPESDGHIKCPHA